MRISTPAFTDGGSIPVEYAYEGENVSPPLVFEDVPSDARSLALIVEDPDAPRGTFIHWALWGVDPHTREVPADRVPPQARQLVNDFGSPEYDGPSPPSGTHRYFFRLYALDTDKLPPPNTHQFHRAMAGHVLEEASVMGRYHRS